MTDEKRVCECPCTRMIRRVITGVRRFGVSRLSPGKPEFYCPICGHRGLFKDKVVSRKPRLVRRDSKCLHCGSCERHRMLYLVLDKLFAGASDKRGKVLHIAPEACLTPVLTRLFASYETADLLKPGVDYHEDIQQMSFPDASYDCVVVSRVLTIPPDLEASVREVRRILRKGGCAVIAETHTHAKTREFGSMINGRSREVGLDILETYRRHFAHVDEIVSSQFDPACQVSNCMVRDGLPADDYPERVRIPGTGFMELVAVCRV